MQRLQPSSLSGYNSSGSERMSDQFPAGLRVLVVDDDLTCLKILEQMLKKCMYTVTTCSRATLALSLLREKKGCFDIVLSDVHMPDMDGYKLLELVGLEMDLPVIMMSADGSTSSVMRGVKHGACDYLVKPVRLEELKNIWQHVIRKKCIENKEHEQSGSLEDNDRHKRVCDDTEYASSVNEGTDGNWKVHRKRKELKDEEDEVEQDSEDPSASKKARVVWSVELHQQFVNAVNQLGIEKAVPKRILELMNVQGLTRENVASHLQKFRLYLKRLSAQNQGAMCGSFGGHLEPNGKMNPITNVSMQALAASGQIPPQAFAALHAEILGRHPGTLVVPGVDQPTLLQEALHGSKGNLIESGSAFAQPLMKSQTPFQKQFSRANIPIEDPSASLAWQQSLGTPTPSNIGALNPHGNNMFVPEKPVQLGSSHLLSMQQSCLVTPATGNCFPGRINPVSSSGTCGMSSPNFTGSSILDYSLLSSPNPAQNCMPIGMDPFSDGDVKNIGLLRCSVSNSVPPAASSCPLPIESNANIQSWQMQSSIPMINVNQSGQLSGFTTSPCEISYGGAQGASELLDQGASRCPGFVSRGPVSLNRFGAASGSMSSVTGDISQGALCLNDGENMLKQELNSDFIDNPKVGMPVLQHFSQKRLDEPSLQIVVDGNRFG